MFCKTDLILGKFLRLFTSRVIDNWRKILNSQQIDSAIVGKIKFWNRYGVAALNIRKLHRQATALLLFINTKYPLLFKKNRKCNKKVKES